MREVRVRVRVLRAEVREDGGVRPSIVAEPEEVVDALELSSATLAKIRQNLVWAFAYNAVGIPLAAGALLPAFGVALTPSAAGALMGVSSVGVMANSLMLQRHSKRLSTEADSGCRQEQG